MPPSIPCLASLILCRNRKSGKQDIPELRLQSGTALRAYLAKLRLDCHTSLADGSLPALAEAVPQTPLQTRGTSPPSVGRPTGSLLAALWADEFLGAKSPLLVLIHAQTSLWSVRSYRDIRGI